MYLFANETFRITPDVHSTPAHEQTLETGLLPLQLHPTFSLLERLRDKLISHIA